MWGKGPNELGCRGFGKSHPISPSSGSRGANVVDFFKLKCSLGSCLRQLAATWSLRTQKIHKIEKVWTVTKKSKTFSFFQGAFGSACARARAANRTPTKSIVPHMYCVYACC